MSYALFRLEKCWDEHHSWSYRKYFCKHSSEVRVCKRGFFSLGFRGCLVGVELGFNPNQQLNPKKSLIHSFPGGFRGRIGRVEVTKFMG